MARNLRNMLCLSMQDVSHKTLLSLKTRALKGVPSKIQDPFR